MSHENTVLQRPMLLLLSISYRYMALLLGDFETDLDYPGVINLFNEYFTSLCILIQLKLGLKAPF